jgi:hypothetical protein
MLNLTQVDHMATVRNDFQGDIAARAKGGASSATRRRRGW